MTATSTTITTTAASTATSTTSHSQATESCWDPSPPGYALDWVAQGRSFFDQWDFLTWDSNHGAAEYLDRGQATAAGVAQAHDTHAILRVGARGAPLKRQTGKIATSKAWKYFLVAVRFTHVPFGCGLWPAFWTHAVGLPWPQGGEMDILEYVNDIASQTSFHTGLQNQCKLDGSKVNKPGCPYMPDLNGMNYDCVTEYPGKIGCAPNTLPLQSPAEWNLSPVTFVMEWTERFMKVFKIPDHELPGDLKSDSPEPSTWDRWLISYYPFAVSGECPNPAEVMAPQQLILNIGLCGDWAGKTWGMASECARLAGPQHGCRVVDPLMEKDPALLQQDCCTQFASDLSGTYGSDDYYENRAFFNISSVKVFQQRH